MWEMGGEHAVAPSYVEGLLTYELRHKAQIYRWVIMHQCTDMRPISTCAQAEERLGERDGGVLFSSMGRAVWGMERGNGGGGSGGG